jgi:hypothetical protein
MCNLYSITKSQDAIRRLFGVAYDQAGNLPKPVLARMAQGGIPLPRAGDELLRVHGQSAEDPAFRAQ